MSVATVKAHVSRLLVKLEVENRVQVALLVQDASLKIASASVAASQGEDPAEPAATAVAQRP